MTVQDWYLDVESPDGVCLHVRAQGEKTSPAIIFIHGFSQSHLSWARQFDGPLADEFYLAALDLRGHGWSDKPDDAAAYRESRRWGDDVAAVLRALDVPRAVLVGWSYGGRVILDYLAAHGSEAIAGINFVAPGIADEDSYYGADIGLIRKTISSDPAESIEGTRAFLRACFAREPDREDFERMLAYNAMTPPAIRAMLLGRDLDAYDLLTQIDVPVLFTHGTEDGIFTPAMSRYGAATVPGAKLSLYEGIGHSTFFEDAPRFNRELRDFVRACVGRAT